MCTLTFVNLILLIEGEDEEVVVEDSFFSLLVDKLLSLHKAKDKAIR